MVRKLLIQNEHLEEFKKSSNDEHPWEGRNLSDWWEDIFPGQKNKLPSKSVSREELKTLCADQAFSDQETVAAVMAWGKMRPINGRELRSNIKYVCEIVSSLRSGDQSRDEAFSAFHNQRVKGKLRGMGAAYFTKLIFFCSPKHDGYIMDQWTSKSVNLISGKKLVKLTNGGHVSDANDASTYIEFCEFIENLSLMGGWSPEETEKRLFSFGGKKKGAWRAHVVEHWSR